LAFTSSDGFLSAGIRLDKFEEGKVVLDAKVSGGITIPITGGLIKDYTRRRAWFEVRTSMDQKMVRQGSCFMQGAQGQYALDLGRYAPASYDIKVFSEADTKGSILAKKGVVVEPFKKDKCSSLKIREIPIFESPFPQDGLVLKASSALPLLYTRGSFLRLRRLEENRASEVAAVYFEPRVDDSISFCSIGEAGRYDLVLQYPGWGLSPITLWKARAFRLPVNDKGIELDEGLSFGLEDLLKRTSVVEVPRGTLPELGLPYAFRAMRRQVDGTWVEVGELSFPKAGKHGGHVMEAEFKKLGFLPWIGLPAGQYRFQLVFESEVPGRELWESELIEVPKTGRVRVKRIPHFDGKTRLKDAVRANSEK